MPVAYVRNMLPSKYTEYVTWLVHVMLLSGSDTPFFFAKKRLLEAGAFVESFCGLF